MHPIFIALNIYLFLSAMITSFFSAYAFIKRGLPVARHLIALSILITIYLFSYIFEINATQIEEMVFWNHIAYLSIPFLPALWVLIALAFTYQKQPLLRWRFLLFIIPVLTFFIHFTNDFHGWYYTSVTAEPNALYTVMVLGKGWWYYVQMVFNLFSIAFASYVMIRFLKRAEAGVKVIARRLVLTSIFPWIGLTLIILPVTGSTGINFSILMFPISIVLFGSIIANRFFLSIKPTARNEFFEKVEQGILVFNHSNILVDANPYALDIFPEMREFINQPLAKLFETYPEFSQFEQTVQISNAPFRGRYYQTHNKRLFDALNHYIGSIFTFVDVTKNIEMLEEMKQNQAHIEYLGTHDALTQLHNRHYLNQIIAQMDTILHPLAVIYIDLNRLKEVNDSKGHDAGDEILRQTAQNIQSSIQENDITVRLGGDEFLILIPKANDTIVQKVITSIHNKSTSNPDLSFAVGYVIKHQTDDIHQAIRLAEEKMYQYKQTTYLT